MRERAPTRNRPTPGSGGFGCCGGPGEVRIVDVGGTPVGINRLGQILKAVRDMNLTDPVLVRRHLLRLTRAANYVPASAEKAYEEALWREYTAGGD